jgi:hypothetical protein
MKRVLIATILGIAASVASSYGQATYFFDTYLPWSQSAGPSGQIVWGPTAPGSLANTVASNDQNLVANLLWSYGTASGIANIGPVGVDQYGFIENAYSNPNGVDYTEVSFLLGVYAPNTPIAFTIDVWRTSDPGVTGYANALWSGSESWIDPGSPVGAGYNTFAQATFPVGSIVLTSVIPEPTTLALAGLGAAGLLMFRKRQ